nr:PD-(D/E)XK nuclease family protein [Pontibacillus yanchengensis]
MLCDTPALSITDILYNDFSDGVVAREWRNIDLMFVSKKHKRVLFFENKDHASLANHQLDTYLQRVKTHYPDMEHYIPVYLTLTGEDAPHNDYYSLGYKTIIDILKSIIMQSKKRMDAKIMDFIQYYIRVLEDLTMEDEKLVQLCKDIYKQNKDAIDAIIEYGIDDSTQFNEAVQEVMSHYDIIDHQKDKRFFNNHKEYWFTPNSFAKQLGELTSNWKSPYPIAYFFAKEESKLKLILKVGPIKDGQERLDLLNKINNNDPNDYFKIRGEALKYQTVKHTKIRTRSIDVSD